MRLLVDIGNSTTVMAIAKADGSIESTWRFKTQKNGTEYFFRNEIIGGLTPRSITPSQIEAVVVSSVVPEVKEELSEAVISVIGKAPHFFCVHDAKRVINIDVESPTQLGNDRVADAIGAVACYGAPVIVFDLGTATTVGVVNEDKCFIGGMIIPGVKTSLSALTTRASQLPTINIEKPKHIIGRNTIECMQSGIIHGTAAMIDGIISDILPSFGNQPVKIVATGGMSKQIMPHCKHEIAVEPHLQFKGIFHATKEL